MMDPRTLADCAALLDRDELEVEHLFDHAELLPALLACIGLALTPKRTPTPQRDVGQAWCSAVFADWGSSTFTASELIVWAEQVATPQQRAVLVASRELCRLKADGDLGAHRLGIALAALVDAPGPLHVVVINARRGARVWAVQDSRG